MLIRTRLRVAPAAVTTVIIITSQPLNQTLANPNGLANQNMVPQTNQNSVPQTSNTLAHQANPIRQLPNNDFLKGRVETALAKAIAASSRPDLDQANPLPVPTTGGSPGGGSPAPVSSKPGSAAAQHQSGEGNLATSTSKCWKSVQKSTKNFQKRSKFSRQKIGKFRQISMSKNAIRIVLGRSRKKFSHKKKNFKQNSKET
jgi:hypothetical protein